MAPANLDTALGPGEPFVRGGDWHQKTRNQEKKQWEGAAKGSFTLTNVTMHLCGDKQWAVPSQELPRQDHPWDIRYPPQSIFTPGLTTFPLFPALMEMSEKLFPPFAPGASAKIHLFVNKISSKSSPNSK